MYRQVTACAGLQYGLPVFHNNSFSTVTGNIKFSVRVCKKIHSLLVHCIRRKKIQGASSIFVSFQSIIQLMIHPVSGYCKLVTHDLKSVLGNTKWNILRSDGIISNSYTLRSRCEWSSIPWVRCFYIAGVL